MSIQNVSEAIPKETALQLCAEIREYYHGKWWTIEGMQCWGCSTFSKDQAHRCVSSRPDYRGCNLVNARYDPSNQGQPCDQH